jgi:hypothetical protein
VIHNLSGLLGTGTIDVMILEFAPPAPPSGMVATDRVVKIG